MEGEGTYTFKNGKTLKGVWKNNKFTGLENVNQNSSNTIKQTIPTSNLNYFTIASTKEAVKKIIEISKR